MSPDQQAPGSQTNEKAILPSLPADFPKGREVTVRRKRKDANGEPTGETYLEPGWIVDGVELDEKTKELKIVIKSPDGLYEKPYSPDFLRSLQPETERASQDGAIEDLGSGAARASGLVEPTADEPQELATARVDENFLASPYSKPGAEVLIPFSRGNIRPYYFSGSYDGQGRPLFHDGVNASSDSMVALIEELYEPSVQQGLRQKFNNEKDSAKPNIDTSAGDSLPELSLGEVDSPDNRVKNFEDLPPEVQQEVNKYRQAQMAKADSERNKDYAQAANDGRRIYEIGKGMSKAAQEFVDFRL